MSEPIANILSAFIFTILYILSIASITTQYKEVGISNDTDLFKYLKTLQDIADRTDRSGTPTDGEYTFDENADPDDTVAAESDTNIDAEENSEDAEGEKYVETPKNILRWLPKLHRVKSYAKMRKEEKAQHAERNKLMARDQNAKRAEYIINTIQNSYWITLYLWGEMTRIIRQRQLKDDIRAMIEVVEKPGNEKMKRDVVNCYRKYKNQARNTLWTDHNTNNLIINHIKHPVHDGVLTRK